MNPDLLILCATDFEISHFLNLCPGSSNRLSKTRRKVISGKISHKTYDLLITGPGVFNCAHALTQYLEHSIPGIILQTGIAGIFKETGFNIGDIAIATQEHYIHTGVQTDILQQAPLPFELLDAHPLSREGKYLFEQKRVDQCHENLSQAFSASSTTIIKSPFITVSSITSSFKQANQLHQVFSPVMEAMEGAASVHVAALYDAPIIEIRAASNYVGERNKSKWDIDLAVKRLGMALSYLF